MSKNQSAIHRLEQQIGEILSATKSIALQLVEFVIFMYGLITILAHAMK